MNSLKQFFELLQIRKYIQSVLAKFSTSVKETVSQMFDLFFGLKHLSGLHLSRIKRFRKLFQIREDIREKTDGGRYGKQGDRVQVVSTESAGSVYRECR